LIRKILQNEANFDERLLPYRKRADEIMVGMNWFLAFITLLIAPIYNTFMSVILITLPTLVLSIYLAKHFSGNLSTRIFMGAAFMIYTGLIIHQTNGDIEAHFSAFGLIGILLYYRDWRVIFVATIVIYLHHLILGYAQTLGIAVYVFDDERFWMLFGLHVAYFLPFIGMMLYLAIWLRRDGYQAQNVIEMAEKIIKGDLVGHYNCDENVIKSMPLVCSVITMKNRLLDLLRIMPVAAAVIRTGDKVVVSSNQAWKNTLGADLELHTKIDELFIWKELNDWSNLVEILHQSERKLIDKYELELKSFEGKKILCELSMILHEDIEPEMAILTIVDITLRKEAEQTMQKLAFTDMLTNIPNRAKLQVELALAYKAWENSQIPFAVVMMDLDGFKPVNDQYGHDAGDEVLRVVGSRMMQIKRSKDIIGRLGGDEFVVIINDCQVVEQAREIGERFIGAISKPIGLRERDVSIKIGASAGIGYVGYDEKSGDDVLKFADIALYESKESGKGKVFVCSKP
jgi:diguanylate cyclase (GGDEF)-like protein